MSDSTPDLPDQNEGDEALSLLPTAVEPHGADAADADDVLDDAGTPSSSEEPG